MSSWALTDTRAAIAWGAEITVTADYLPDFVVPTRIEFDRAVHRLGRIADFTARAATVTVAPVPFARSHRYERPNRALHCLCGGIDWCAALVVSFRRLGDRPRGRFSWVT